MEKLEDLLRALAQPTKKYWASQKHRIEKGFNLFYLISDYYYRETFHNDVIGALLSPNEKHNGGRMYLDKFIDMINICLIDNKAQSIKIEDYPAPLVLLEYHTDDGNLKGRIDIFVDGGNFNGKKHCRRCGSHL